VAQLIAQGLTMVAAQAGLRSRDRMPVYLANLGRLNLIETTDDPLERPAEYQLLEAQPHVLSLLRATPRSRTVRRRLALSGVPKRLPASELGGGHREALRARLGRDALCVEERVLAAREVLWQNEYQSSCQLPVVCCQWIQSPLCQLTTGTWSEGTIDHVEVCFASSFMESQAQQNMD